MGFDQGRIVFNSDTGIYYSGQTVYGKLIFDQDTNKTFRGIYVKIKGYCNVQWQTTHSRSVNGKRETYHENHYASEDYINQKIYLIGSESGEVTIQPGHHEFPFQFPIPQQVPSSFEGDHGHVRYEVKAVVDRAFKMDQEKKAVVKVIAPLDLNTVHGIDEPVQYLFNEKYYCCCTSSGSMNAVVKLPAAGYCPGQAIPIEVSCNNTSTVTIDTITFTLKKDIKFHAQGKTKSRTEEVAQLELGEVRANNSRTYAAEMIVPNVDSPNMVHCRYIDVEYYMKVTVSPDGCHRDSSQRHKIVIGTIPLRSLPYSPNMQTQIVQQNVPNVTQVTPYPGNVAYPGANPYPGAVPFQNNQYPGDTNQYPNTNSDANAFPNHPPFPPSYNESVSGNTSYPANPAVPYPTASPYPQTSPYPQSSPYPQQSPYPQTSPYPTNSPYPPTVPATNPIIQKPISTGTLGFTAQGSMNPTMAPPLPAGAAMPYPPNMSQNPFATASAPSSDPFDEDKKMLP